ncbi:P-loop containing nucleoside triphosphate hydrolase [Sesbania bispinosa]|nr:P-loop containing nucleoside triphosphate hydrolase [Sesbania bispinosa]
MAGALVGGAFLSGFINVVFERLSSPVVVNLIRGKKLDHKLLQRLETTLYAVQVVLNDAEHKQIKDPAVKKWLDDLKDALYVADDLLDEVSTRAATQKEVSSFLSRYLNFQDREIVNELEDITNRLEAIGKNKDILGLKEIARQNSLWRTPSTSLLEGSNIYGREEDKKAIIKLLLDDNCDVKVSVVPIVGMGGIGKTTLAQLVYNDDTMMQNFDFKAWVCVSEEFNIQKVTKTIIEAVTSISCDMKDLNLLQLDLKEKLTGKKFFIVLDDIWNEDYVDWNILIKPFQYGVKGSKLLVTTRSEKVASVVQTFPSYYLSQLSDEDCWLVFASHAFLSPELKENSTLERIGRQIIKKCKGLPLAAQTLGGLLRSKRDVEDWNTILKSEIWELPDNQSKIIPALRISYHFLPAKLKRCFAYCSLYPKNHKFDKEELILLWMAEDLLQSTNVGKTLEEVGWEYFDELTSRSCFQRFSIESDLFVMQDLMHDLATFAAGEFYFRLEEPKKANKISFRTRHLSYSMSSYPISRNLETFDRVKHLRTFLPINSQFVPLNFEKVPHIMLSKFKYLRVLSFRCFRDLNTLPSSIGELIHLRYLDLSWTSIQRLPESLCNLHNLQTLKLYYCDKLTRLPNGMQNLVNLRHLDIGESCIQEMPRGIGQLKDLQLLTDFVVGEHEENGIRELGGLAKLHGSFGIARLENVHNSNEALEARMMDKKHLNTLYYGWTPDSNSVDSQHERDILEKLQPHRDLKELMMNSYRGTRFPDWVGHSSYHNMTSVVLESCHNCYTLPSFGQLPSLKSLTIISFNVLETIGTEFYKNDSSCWVTPFASLEYLEFRYMACWQTWHSGEPNAFPQLKQLSIRYCPKLIGNLPNHLPSLEILSLKGCEQLTSSLPSAPAIRIEISESNKVTLQELPLSLHSLSIAGSQVVESMFKSMTNAKLTFLQSLRISGCWSAMSFPEGCLPVSLKTLYIRDCKKLEFPKNQHQQLELLMINNSCDSLTTFPLEMFPNLKYLEFTECQNLESLSVSQDAAFQSLKSFTIHGCPNFVSFGGEGLATLSMNTLLPKLEDLTIKHCPGIDSSQFWGLSPNIRSLNITNCKKLLSCLTSKDLVLQSLTHLSIGGECYGVMYFPEKGLLPSSLMQLELNGLLNLETLDCNGFLQLTSLRQLTITNCPKLENMEGERLPASLSQLYIYYCPLMEEQCQKKHPQIWPKISHIPDIRASYRRIW